eukprot:g3501.t1
MATNPKSSNEDVDAPSGTDSRGNLEKLTPRIPSDEPPPSNGTTSAPPQLCRSFSSSPRKPFVAVRLFWDYREGVRKRKNLTTPEHCTAIVKAALDALNKSRPKNEQLKYVDENLRRSCFIYTDGRKSPDTKEEVIVVSDSKWRTISVVQCPVSGKMKKFRGFVERKVCIDLTNYAFTYRNAKPICIIVTDIKELGGKQHANSNLLYCLNLIRDVGVKTVLVNGATPQRQDNLDRIFWETIADKVLQFGEIFKDNPTRDPPMPTFLTPEPLMGELFDGTDLSKLIPLKLRFMESKEASSALCANPSGRAEVDRVKKSKAGAIPVHHGSKSEAKSADANVFESAAPTLPVPYQEVPFEAAVFWDMENIPVSIGIESKLRKMLTRIYGKVKIRSRRYYFDSQQQHVMTTKLRRMLNTLGWVACDCTSMGVLETVDTRIIVDMIQFVWYAHIHGVDPIVVLVSDDNDFNYAVRVLTDLGALVVNLRSSKCSHQFDIPRSVDVAYKIARPGNLLECIFRRVSPDVRGTISEWTNEGGGHGKIKFNFQNEGSLCKCEIQVLLRDIVSGRHYITKYNAAVGTPVLFQIIVQSNTHLLSDLSAGRL